MGLYRPEKGAGVRAQQAGLTGCCAHSRCRADRKGRAAAATTTPTAAAGRAPRRTPTHDLDRNCRVESRAVAQRRYGVGAVAATPACRTYR